MIATVIGPGAVASAPYAGLWLSAAPALRAFLAGHEAIAVASTILVWIVIGFAIESTGSYVEVYWIDRRRPDHRRMVETWWCYLRIAWDREPIGQRYLRRFLVSFKFELNMFVATLTSIPGILLLGAFGRVTWLPALVAVAIVAIASFLLFTAARGSAEVLAEVRTRLVRGVGEPPFDDNGDPGRPKAADRAAAPARDGRVSE